MEKITIKVKALHKEDKRNAKLLQEYLNLSEFGKKAIESFDRVVREAVLRQHLEGIR